MDALAKAAKADNISKLSDKVKTEALSEALARTEKLKANVRKAAENAGHAGIQLVHVGETQGTLALGSFAEGFAQQKWKKSLKVGPVPVRGTLGLLIAGWGLYEAVTTGKGTHQMAVAQGLIGSEIASLGLQAGAALAEKMAKGAPADAAAGAGAGGAGQLTEVPAAVQGETREIHAEASRAPVSRLFDRARRA